MRASRSSTQSHVAERAFARLCRGFVQGGSEAQKQKRGLLRKRVE